jgi:integrase
LSQTRCTSSPAGTARSFARICKRCGVRLVPVHAIRHSVATPPKALKVPPRDAQAILGHADISTTQQIYTHVDEDARRDALARLNELFGGSE